MRKVGWNATPQRVIAPSKKQRTTKKVMLPRTTATICNQTYKTPNNSQTDSEQVPRGKGEKNY